MQQPQSKNITLNDILLTEELSRRSPRPPNWQAENQAMQTLIRQMTRNSTTLLHSLVEIALNLCQAGTAGISLLETTAEGEEILRWVVLAGKLSSYANNIIPRNFSPCGICLNQKTLQPQLYAYPERYFTYLQVKDIPIVEGLVLPLIAENIVLGTIWIASHHQQQQFDSEDVRVMKSLADFTTTALLLKQRQNQKLQLKNIQLKAEMAERKRAESSAQKMEADFEAIANLVPDLLWRSDVRGNIIWYNQRWLNYTGQTLEDAQGYGWLAVIHPDDRSQSLSNFQDAVNQGHPLRQEHRILGANGKYRWFLIRVEPQRDEKGHIVGWFGAATDIHERKQVEAALRQSEDRLRMAIESAQLGIWDWNLITNQLTWDKGCKAMFGLSPNQETSIEVFFEGLHPDDRNRLDKIVQSILKGENEGKYEVEYRTVDIQDGTERWIFAKGQAYFDVGGKPYRFIGTVLDITEQKQIEQEREKLLEREKAARLEAERVNRIKDEFLALLSHELRTPLNPILGWTKLLQTRQFDQAQMTQALAIIERNVNLQTQLINDLLDIARILRGKLSLNVTVVNLSSVIEAALETVKTAANAKSISIQGVLPDIGQISGDAARLQQIFWNLLSNAIKFTPIGGNVEIRLKKMDNIAEIAIKDTGKGINPDFLPHIFNLFQQEDASTTRQYGGLGLGLAIVRQLVEAHGGTIRADSEGLGQGATFTVRLPLLNLEKDRENQPTQKLIPND